MSSREIKIGDPVRSLDGANAPVKGVVVRVEPPPGKFSNVPEQIFVLWGPSSWAQ